MEKRRVVITGMGTVNPLGHNVAESWQAVPMPVMTTLRLFPIVSTSSGHIPMPPSTPSTCPVM